MAPFSTRQGLLLLVALAGVLPARAQFVFTLGGSGFDAGEGIGFDAAGNVYATGAFRGTLDFDGGAGVHMLTSTMQDVYVASYTPEGALRFAFGIGSRFATSEDVGGLAVAPDGTFFVTGSQPFGSIDYDPDPLATETRAGRLFLASYTAAGAFRFAVTPQGAGGAVGMGHAVALDAAGNAYVTGTFTDTLDFSPAADGTGRLVSAGNTDVFVAGYSYEGDLRFAFRLGGTSADAGLGIAADGMGNVYVAGIASGSTPFDPDDRDGDGNRERRGFGGSAPFLASYTADGVLRFAYVFGPNGTAPATAPPPDATYRVAADGAGHVCLAGTIAGPAFFDPDDRDGNGNREGREVAGGGSAFVAGYTTEGVFRFATVATGSSGARGVALHPSGDCFVAGTFGGTVAFALGADSLDAGVGTDAFVARYSAEGRYRGAFAFGGSGLTTARALAVDADAQFAVTGTFTNTAFFTPGDARTGHGQTDLFIARYPASTLPVARTPAPELPGSLQIAVAPTPFSTSTRIHVSAFPPQRVRIAVFDALGRCVARPFEGWVDGRGAVSFAPEGLAPGLYFVRVQGDGASATQPIVRVE